MARASFDVSLADVAKLTSVPDELIDGLVGKVTVSFVIDKRSEPVARACGIGKEEQANLENQVAIELAQILGMPV